MYKVIPLKRHNPSLIVIINTLAKNEACLNLAACFVLMIKASQEEE